LEIIHYFKINLTTTPANRAIITVPITAKNLSFTMNYNALIAFTLLAASNITPAATVTKTTIKSVSVTPTSAPAGTMFKFSATLDAPLTVGNKVKIALGKQSKPMIGNGTQYTFSQSTFTTGKQNYNVGIYNAKNVLQGTVKAGTYAVTSASPINHAPTLTLVSADKSATANAIYTVTLNAKDVDANLSSITMSWGDSTSPDTLAATDGKNLILTHTYEKVGTFALSAVATDNASPVLNSKATTKTITVATPVVVKGNYSKIANDGSELSDSATLGSNRKDWACTKDSKTGLIWMVDVSIQSATAECGTTNWSIPTITEMNSLSSTACSIAQINNYLQFSCSGVPINKDFFPNSPSPAIFKTSSEHYGWSSSGGGSLSFSEGYSWSSAGEPDWYLTGSGSEYSNNALVRFVSRLK